MYKELDLTTSTRDKKGRISWPDKNRTSHNARNDVACDIKHAVSHYACVVSRSFRPTSVGCFPQSRILWKNNTKRWLHMPTFKLCPSCHNSWYNGDPVSRLWHFAKAGYITEVTPEDGNRICETSTIQPTSMWCHQENQHWHRTAFKDSNHLKFK